MTTMREVSAPRGVSAKTVSRVFNDDPHDAGTRSGSKWPSAG
jgi:DNA-binding LacI/PurR family transcriptional regulator